MAKTFFITTAIDYTNSPPHVGHAYEKVLADVIARYHRLRGEKVFFLTGVDQHGQNVQQSPEKKCNNPPKNKESPQRDSFALSRNSSSRFGKNCTSSTTDGLRLRKSVTKP